MKRINELITTAESKLIRKVIYPLWTLRDHPRYLHYARIFERGQWLPEIELRQLQLRLLRDQLVHAYRNIEFYRRRMNASGITPFDIRSIDDLRMLPILTKRDIQEHPSQLLAGNVPATRRSINQTGGSTGSPLQFWVDNERFDARRATTDRHNGWAGLHPGDWCAVLWGSTYDIGTASIPEITWQQHFLHRSLTLNTSLISKEDLNNFVALLRRYRPRRLKAYAQSAAMFARYCREIGADDIRFDSIITSAEVLLPENRVLIEETFGGRVFDRYGCREISVIASECEHHTGLHINADALIVEIDPLTGGPPNTGRVLVTDLYNRSMPLIRYEIGDLAQWSSNGPCPCGRSLPRLASVEGRITDFLRLPDGKIVSGPSLALLVGQVVEIRQAQFVQPGPGEIRLDVIPADGYGPNTVEELQRRLFPYLRGQVRFSVRPVERIASEISGKYRFVKTEYDEVNPHATLV
jgi:phenylacetate-CoA ligase